MSLVKRIWNGEERLVKVYWVYAVLIGSLLGFFTKTSYSLTASPTLHLIAYFAFLAYLLIVSVGMWRSANAYRGIKLWAVLAKIWVILNLSFTALVLISISKNIYENTNQQPQYDGKLNYKKGSNGILSGWTEVGEGLKYKKNNDGIATVEFKTSQSDLADGQKGYKFTLIQLNFNCNELTQKPIAMINVVEENNKLKEIPLPINQNKLDWIGIDTNNKNIVKVFNTVCLNAKLE